MFLAGLLAALTAGPARADWKPVDKLETYAITGATGRELYESIGENGPQLGVARVVAYTTFDLKWSRDYRPSKGGCTLAKARPHLILITKLPKPKGKLPPAAEAAWRTFIDGIRAHEAIHGQHMIEMVEAIEAYSVGLRVEDDPNCKKIRQVLTKRLGELSQEQRRRSNEFDKVEMSQGGNVHRLILALINGG
ncbi:MAG: DUF922 domain-containing Zn-dependent protease [Rhizobiaceae bacterium]